MEIFDICTIYLFEIIDILVYCVWRSNCKLFQQMVGRVTRPGEWEITQNSIVVINFVDKQCKILSFFLLPPLSKRIKKSLLMND